MHNEALPFMGILEPVASAYFFGTQDDLEWELADAMYALIPDGDYSFESMSGTLTTALISI